MSLDVLPGLAPLSSALQPAQPGVGAERSFPTPGERAERPSPVSTSSSAVALALSPDAAVAFGAAQKTDGLNTALRRLQDGAFGTPGVGSPLSLAALVDGIRAENGLPALDTSRDGLPTTTLPGTSSVELAQTRSGALNWVIGVLQGDFNENPSLSQTIANTVLTAIPGLDQVGDARDILKAVIDIRADPTNTWAWMGAALTGVGLVPTVGSVLKGVGRLAVNGEGAYDLYRALDRIGVAEPGRFLRDNVGGLAQDAVHLVGDGLDRLARALDGISGLHPALATAAGEVGAVSRMGTDRLHAAADHVQDRVRHVANRMPSRVASPESAARAVRDFTTQTYHVGGVNFVLGQNRMQHFLQRHHPDHWTGQVKTNQTFFDRRMSVDDVRGAVEATLRQNREAFLNGAARPGHSVYGTYNGVQYQMKVGGYAQNGMLEIGQFYPVSP